MSETGTGYYKVHELPKRMQPRELFDLHGGENVPDEVLLAILLRSGTPGHNVVDLSADLLRSFGSLTALTRVSPKELTKIRGIGMVKARELKAALELARRLGQEEHGSVPMIQTPEDAARLFREQARTLDEEHFWVLVLDMKNRLKRPPQQISKGLLNVSLVHAREVFAEACVHKAAAIILAHNHPSGDCTPSPEDIRVTRKLIDAGNVMDIPVYDHVIVGRAGVGQSRYFSSLRESGLVNFEPSR